MKLHQVSVAGSVNFFKKGFIERWGLKERYDLNLPCFFLGIEQIDKINEHIGLKIIYPISPWDCTFLDKVEKKDNIILINSPFLPSNHGYKTKNVEIELKEYGMFSPKPLGDKIYTYIGWESRKNEFLFDKIMEIQSQIPWEIIYLVNDTYRSIEDLKKNYYDKVFLNINLSHGTGMTTVRELGMMGIKTIMNTEYKFPSIINYTDTKNIIDMIHEESKKIGTIQEKMDCHTVKDEWLDVDFWIGENQNYTGKLLEMRNNQNYPGLIHLINYLPKGSKMAEIGCYAGESTKLFINSKKFEEIHAIDIWEDVSNVYENICKDHSFELVERKFDKNVEGANVKKHKQTLENVINGLPELDFVYIDADHEYESVVKDIKNSLKKIKKNGIISGHDYDESSPGVIKAVNEIFGKPDMVFSDSSWLVHLK